MRTRGQAHHGEKVGWGNATYDVEMIETPSGRLGGGISRGCKGQRDSGERVSGGSEVRRGWTSCAALSEGPLFWWYVPCHALPYAMSMMRVSWFWSECIHPRDYRTYHDFFQTSRSTRNVADLVLLFWFADGRCTINLSEDISLSLR